MIYRGLFEKPHLYLLRRYASSQSTFNEHQKSIDVEAPISSIHKLSGKLIHYTAQAISEGG